MYLFVYLCIYLLYPKLQWPLYNYNDDGNEYHIVNIVLMTSIGRSFITIMITIRFERRIYLQYRLQIQWYWHFERTLL